MSLDNGLSGPRIALLIDFDNVILGVDDPGFDVELVVNALRERGTIVMGRAYGDWYRHNKHRRKLMEHGVELVETPAFGPVIKNSADIRIALDGYEIGMTQHHIDTFCLVSGDSDFLPLIKKLQYLGKKVLVISGTKFTSDMLRRNCNEFVSYENLLAQSVGATEDATTLDGAFALLHRAIAALRERGSEVRSSTVKQMMLQLNPVFSEKTFNCNQFRGFLDKAVDARVIKLGGRDRASGEITVLLPEDEEKLDERRDISEAREPREVREPREAISEPEGRPDRRRRAEMRAERAAQMANAVDSIDAVLDLATTTPEDRQLDTAETKAPESHRPLRGGRRGRDAAPVGDDTEAFAPATQDDTASRATTASALLGRGMRRGRLRFAAGRLVANAPEAAPAPETATEPAPEADALAATLDAPVTTETWPEFAQAETTPDPVTEGLFVVTDAPAAPVEAPAEPAVTEGLAVEAEAPAKKPARRRSPRKKAEAPAEGEAQAAAPEAATEAPATEAAPKKPARRRSPRKKADTPPAAEG